MGHLRTLRPSGLPSPPNPSSVRANRAAAARERGWRSHGGRTDAGQIDPQRHANDTSASDLFKGEVTSIRTPTDSFDTQKCHVRAFRVGPNQMWQLSHFDTGSCSISTEPQPLSCQKGHFSNEAKGHLGHRHDLKCPRFKNTSSASQGRLHAAI